jgi:hypothetical protein
MYLPDYIDRFKLFSFCNAGFILVFGLLGSYLLTDPKVMEKEREEDALRSAGEQFLEDYNVQQSVYSSASKPKNKQS